MPRQWFNDCPTYVDDFDFDNLNCDHNHGVHEHFDERRCAARGSTRPNHY